MSSIEDLLQQNSTNDAGQTATDNKANTSSMVPPSHTSNSDDNQDQDTASVSTKTTAPTINSSESHAPFGEVSTKLDAKINEMRQHEHEQELKNKAQQMSLGYINLKGIPISAEILRHLDFDFAKKNQIICFYYAPHERVRLAIAEKNIDQLPDIEKDLSEIFNKIKIEWFLTSTLSFESAIKQYENLPKIKEPAKGVEISSQDLSVLSDQINSLADIKIKLKDVSLTQTLTLIIAAGVKTGSSDIHIEAEADGIKLRYRIDGVLHTAAMLDRSLWHQIISRLKLLSELKLNIADKPQDGRFSIFLAHEKLDVRISTLPTAYGESVVMRLLLSKAVALKFEEIGLNEKYFKLLSQEMKRPNGMIITTGPTGSGKTTTLYTVLNRLNTPEAKIITVEDPIEYELTGVNQSQVDENAGYTFAKGLRSIVRQDPDIIMVGEMRDIETVDIALNAALTGHLVLSTLHTNDAAGAIPRFLAMGAKPYLLAPALNLIMAQRLVRKLCDGCKKETEIDEITKQKIDKILANISAEEKNEFNLDQAKFYQATGCEQCNQLGYKGRIGIFEMFNMTPEIEQVILSNEVSEYKIRDLAIKNGMLTMAADGVFKAAKGITSLDEVFRVID